MKMTTTVTIAAHHSAEKEVLVKITDNGSTVEEFSLQDGEKAERYVYDGREISVQEVTK
jgi:archaellum component FlaF (FlaF/FlaG flagellin family)